MLREEVSILVVDDVNTMRVQIRELLRSFGFQKVAVAANGEEAKRVLDQGDVHLIMADWHMSPTSGLELLRYVRAHPKLKHLAYILVTAENTRELVIDAIKSGVDDYLVKPLTPAMIQNKVYGVLFKKQVFA